MALQAHSHTGTSSFTASQLPQSHRQHRGGTVLLPRRTGPSAHWSHSLACRLEFSSLTTCQVSKFRAASGLNPPSSTEYEHTHKGYLAPTVPKLSPFDLPSPVPERKGLRDISAGRICHWTCHQEFTCSSQYPRCKYQVSAVLQTRRFC